MRGGRDLVASDFNKVKNKKYTTLFNSYESICRNKFRLLSKRKKNNTNKEKIINYNYKLEQARHDLHYHVKIEEMITEEMITFYLYFGNIVIQANNTGYHNYYKYVIFTDYKKKVILLQLNPDFTISDVVQIDDELKDYLLKLYKILENEPNDSKLRIQNFIKEKLRINNESADSISNKQRNSPARVRSEPETLLNGSIKYPANYDFSGKINDNYFNTNKNFRGIGTGKNRIPCKLYKYNPKENSYELLLTELDYLVNVYDNDGKVKITYSGVYNSTPIYAGETKIPIEDINHYLYTTKKFPDGPCWIISLN